MSDESVSLLTNDLTYRRVAHDSAMHDVTDLEDRLIWSVNEYFSSLGKASVILKISIASL